jgi:hypothetical protein
MSLLMALVLEWQLASVSLEEDEDWALHLPGDRILRRLFYLGLSHQSNFFCFSLIA